LCQFQRRLTSGWPPPIGTPTTYAGRGGRAQLLLLMPQSCSMHSCTPWRLLHLAVLDLWTCGMLLDVYAASMY